MKKKTNTFKYDSNRCFSCGNCKYLDVSSFRNVSTKYSTITYFNCNPPSKLGILHNKHFTNIEHLYMMGCSSQYSPNIFQEPVQLKLNLGVF